jgi:hypothetical protein
MGRTVLAIALAAIGVVTAVTGTILLAVDGFAGDAVLVTFAVLSLATVGAVLASRVPANVMGLLLLVAALALGVETFGAGYAHRSSLVAGGTWPGTTVAAWVYSNLLGIPLGIMAMGVPLVYPDGRLLSPRWRWLVAYQPPPDGVRAAPDP